MPNYTDYEAVPDDNKNGSSPTRMPEGNYQGKWVNDTLRYMASVIRILGNSAAFLPLGNTLGKYIGSLAFQNADDVAITGGFFRGRGYVFVGALMDFRQRGRHLRRQHADHHRGGRACGGHDGRHRIDGGEPAARADNGRS
jgi:hypothetical protein